MQPRPPILTTLFASLPIFSKRTQLPRRDVYASGLMNSRRNLLGFYKDRIKSR
jgi:hypothetical protein